MLERKFQVKVIGPCHLSDDVAATGHSAAEAEAMGRYRCRLAYSWHPDSYPDAKVWCVSATPDDDFASAEFLGYPSVTPNSSDPAEPYC